jgi:hypothetical protein
MSKFYSVIGYAIQEEIARAQLVGDGRSPASDDKIKEDKIRPNNKRGGIY